MILRRRPRLSFALASLIFVCIKSTSTFHQSHIQVLGRYLHKTQLLSDLKDGTHCDTLEQRITPEMDRRLALTWGCGSILATSLIGNLDPALAEAASVAPITHKVFMDVRVSRQDGTFYVRDDLEDLPENRVFYGKLKLGLFGTIAPTTVERFLSYVNVNYSPLDDNPLPSYGRSSFRSFDQATGLIVGGYIPGLELTSFGGGTALQYGGRVLSAPLWVDKETKRLPHNSRGLLTHRSLDVTPTFGITTRSSTPELDSTNIVFGQVLSDDSSRAFLQLVQDLPTYSLERQRVGDPREATVVDGVAAAVFNSQRVFFRGAAKTLGDSRIDKVYEGKLLRRVEITQVGLM